MFCGKSLEEIRSDLAALKGFWVVIYGSCVKGRDTPRSDIDIAVITGVREREKNIKIYKKL